MSILSAVPSRLKALFLLPLVLAASVSLSARPASAKRRPTLKMPINEKLTNGAGPGTHALDKGTGSRQKLASRGDLLAPVSLAEVETDSNQQSASPDNDRNFLKSTITMSEYAPKGPIDPAGRSIFSVKPGEASPVGSAGNNLSDPFKLLEQARNVNAVPLPLMQTEDEAREKAECILNAEKEQLSQLWEATLTRSPDIQFVVQKLMPSSNPGRATTIMMRMLSSAVFGAMGAASMMAPNIGTYAANSIGASMVMNALQMQEGKSAKKARLTQTEAIMLYNMVRDTADKLVSNYRSYKKAVALMTRAAADLTDLQSMVRDARAGQDALRQLEMEYTIRKAQRDVDGVSEDLKRYRQALSDLAGQEAIAKLDQKLDAGQYTLLDTTPGSPAPPTRTASAPGTSL